MQVSFFSNNILSKPSFGLNSEPVSAAPSERNFATVNCDIYSFNKSKHINNLIGKHYNPVKIVFSDIDGTIAEEGKVNPAAKKAILELQKNNIPIIIATGRVYDGAKKKIEKMGLSLSEHDYVITQQGTVITDGKGQILYEKTLSKGDALDIIKTAEEYIEAYDDKALQVVLYVGGKPYSKAGVKLGNHSETPIKAESFEKLMEEKGLPDKIILFKEDSKLPSDMKAMKKYFQDMLYDRNLNFLITCDSYCELTNGDTSKGEAMRQVARLAGTKLKNAACLGDAENDLQMMQVINDYGGLSIAMGNGLPTVKEAAKYVTDHISDNGYAKAIYTILTNNEMINRKYC